MLRVPCPTAGTLRLTRSARVAWTGAAVFLLSLLWSAYEYLIGFDTRTANHAPAVAVTFDVLLFSLFALHHSLLARSGAKRLVVQRVPAELERSLYTWAASLLFIAGVHLLARRFLGPCTCSTVSGARSVTSCSSPASS